MFTINPVVVIDDTFINPAVEPDIVAVTFGTDANAVENVTANVPELVVPDPYKYLVILNVDTFPAMDDTFVFTVDTFPAMDDTFVFTVDTFPAMDDTFIVIVDTFVFTVDTFAAMDDTFTVIVDTFLFTVDTFAAIISTPPFKVVGIGETQFTEAAGI